MTQGSTNHEGNKTHFSMNLLLHIHSELLHNLHSVVSCNNHVKCVVEWQPPESFCQILHVPLPQVCASPQLYEGYDASLSLCVCKSLTDSGRNECSGRCGDRMRPVLQLVCSSAVLTLLYTEANRQVQATGPTQWSYISSLEGLNSWLHCFLVYLSHMNFSLAITLWV